MGCCAAPGGPPAAYVPSVMLLSGAVCRTDGIVRCIAAALSAIG